MIAKVLASGTATPTDLTTYALTSYTIGTPLDDPIPVGGSILIVFPPTTSPESASLAAASFVRSSCTVQELTANNVEILNCFSTSLTAASFSVTLTNIRNPPSLQTTASFAIYVRGPSGSTINYITSGVTVTMATPTTTTSFTIAPSSLVVASVVSYTFTIALAIDIHQSNDYMLIGLPALMVVPSTPSCVAISGIASINCIAASALTLKVVLTSAPTAGSIVFSLGTVQNYRVAETLGFSLDIFNSGNYAMESKSSSTVTFVKSTISSSSLNFNDNIAVGGFSNITVTLTNSFALYSSFDVALTVLDIHVPADFTIGPNCSVTGGGSCSVLNSSVYRVTSVGLSLTNLNVTLNNLLLSYFDPSSATFKVEYSYNSHMVSTVESGLFLSVFCTKPCQRCNIVPTACESCLPLLTGNTFIYFDPVAATCGTSCVSGKYPDLTN